MSATLLLEKEVSIQTQDESRKNVENESTTCTCGIAQMASHNAVCRACSITKSAAK